MFERPTVFIVGAGASREVNFPIGADLTGIIGRKLNIKFANGYNLLSGDRLIVEAVQRKAQEEQRSDRNFYWKAGQSISQAMGQAISIDNYLHTHSDDEMITFMGKLGIASSIIEAEASSHLALRESYNDSIDLNRSAISWYNTFFQMLSEGNQRTKVDDIFENVAFVTFNYDRCIEHYMTFAIANYYKMSVQNAQSVVMKLRVEHPYGQVGYLPWQRPNESIAFGERLSVSQLPRVVSQVRTFTERVEDDAMITRMRKIISEAEVIVYLGFSYGDMNMKLLTIDETRPRMIFGTSLGLSEPNKRVIVRDIMSATGGGKYTKEAELADMTCNEFLKSYWKPILRGRS